MRASLVIPAAGRGQRFGSDTPKQFLPLRGRSVLARTLAAFDGLVDEAVIAGDPSARDLIAAAVAESHVSFPVRVVDGGETRLRSVEAAVSAAAGDAVLVHDAVRPLVPRSCIEACLAATARTGAAVVAIRCAHTVKRGAGTTVAATVPRDDLWLAQTPQGFRRALGAAAFARAIAEGWECSDDAQVIERAGGAVELVPGDARNLKITTPDDLALAEAILAAAAPGL